jgi:hypothetical protein
MLGYMTSGDAYDGWLLLVPAAVCGSAFGFGARTAIVPGWPTRCMSPLDDADGWIAGCGIRAPTGRPGARGSSMT